MISTHDQDFLQLVRAERERQEEKHPGQENLSIHDWGCLLTEEFLEAVRAINDFTHRKPGATEGEIVDELVQVAAVCFRIYAKNASLRAAGRLDDARTARILATIRGEICER
mgnify:FL=1